MEFVVDEIGLAVGISRVAASNRLELAQDLTGALPAVLESLQTASIDLIRARIIAEGTEPSTGTCVPPSPSSTWPPATSTPTPPSDQPVRQAAPPAWAQVQVVLPANLLTGSGPEPAELIGSGPIPTSMAHRMAGDASWQRLLTDHVSGALTDVGRTRYTPPSPTRRPPPF